MKNFDSQDRMLKAMMQHDVAVELNGLLFAQTIGVKKDPVGEFIAKFIFTEHIKGKCVSMLTIVNTLHESDNTIRKKINALIAINFITKNTCCNDLRNKCYKPTALLKRVYQVDMTKRIKCLLELSPLLDSVLGEQINSIFDDMGTADHVSYLKTQDTHTYNKFIKEYHLEFIKSGDRNRDVKNTLKKLG